MQVVCFCWLWIFFKFVLINLTMLDWRNLRLCKYRHSLVTINFPYLNSLALYNIPIFLEICFSFYLMWSFDERFSSSNTPSNLIDGILSMLVDSWDYMPPILVPSSAKRISTRILVITKLSGRKNFILRDFSMILFVQAQNYLFKVSNWRTKIRCESYSKLRIKILQRCQ